MDSLVYTRDGLVELYRVAGAEYEYTADDGSRTSVDEGLDWREEMAATRPNDPMRTDPARMATTPPADRMVSMTWAYDWLGNMQSWDDDASAFYERSLGDIVNGADLSTPGPRRPGALYVASNLPSTPALTGTMDQGGWLEVRYGEDGNALALTVHAQCADPSLNSIPIACRSTGHAEAIALSCAWSCASEQHYTYAWDEVNRIAEARRYDRDPGGSWSLAVQQRYLYDSANQRTVKSTTFRDEETVTTRAALYVYPGDFERRGLVVGFGQAGPTYQAISGDTETQYVVGGARIVWRSDRDGMGIDQDQRITIGLTDLIQSTTAVLDLASGELLETGSYYANGARETYRASSHGDRVAAEPMGFTGKEADEEVGLTYFGQRYLMSHLGRWASPDPLQTHAVGGGEALNGYHYVAGNVLQARDPVGLTIDTADHSANSEGSPDTRGLDMSQAQDLDTARDLERRMVDSIMVEANSLSAELRRRGDVAGAAETLLWGAARAQAIHLDETSGEIVVDRVDGAEDHPGNNLYSRYLAASEDSRTYQLGYGQPRTRALGSTEFAGTMTRGRDGITRFMDDAVIPVIIDRDSIYKHIGPESTSFRTAAVDWGDFESAITGTLAHELSIHAGRVAMGFDRLSAGHAPYGFHSSGGDAEDNYADREAHWIYVIFGAENNWSHLHHSGGPTSVPPAIDLASFRYEGAP